MDAIETDISVGQIYGKMVAPNLTLQNTTFWGRPNFRGEENQFGDARKSFTVLIRPENADALRALGYNCKTHFPTPEEVEQGRTEIASLKVMVDNPMYEDGVQVSGSEIYIRMGDQNEKLNAQTMAILDKSRVHQLDMEIRAWDYPKREGNEPYSARLVKLIAVIERDILGEKYGMLA